MSKHLYISVMLFSLVLPSVAKADIEIVQKTITVLEKTQDTVNVVGQKLNAAGEYIINTREGIASARSQFTSKFNEVRDQVKGFNVKRFAEAKINPIIGNIQNERAIEKDLEENAIFQAGGENETARSQEQDVKMKAMLGEAVANMYTKALITRVYVTKEKPVDVERANTQDIIRAINEKKESIAARTNNVRELEILYTEYISTDSSKEFAGGSSEEGKDLDKKSDSKGADGKEAGNKDADKSNPAKVEEKKEANNADNKTGENKG